MTARQVHGSETLISCQPCPEVRRILGELDYLSSILDEELRKTHRGELEKELVEHIRECAEISNNGAGWFGLLVREIVAAWNELGAPYPKLRPITPGGPRYAKLQARSREQTFLEEWPTAIAEYRENPWMRGDPGSGKRDDRPTPFDYLIQNADSIVKILEWRHKRLEREKREGQQRSGRY